jgi:hypothetical protein
MRQYTFDANNRYTGFLDSDIFVENSTAIAPATSDHKLWNAAGSVWEVIPPVPVSLESVKLDRIHEARDYHNEIIVSFESDAAEFELATWETQRSEWVRYIEGGIMFKIDGDESGIIDQFELITGVTSGCTGIVNSVEYNATTNTTKVTVGKLSTMLEVGETITDGTNTTTNAITSITKLSTTPYCERLAMIRNITIDELMGKIGYKVMGIATVQGTLHKLEDDINACLTVEDVLAIGW